MSVFSTTESQRHRETQLPGKPFHFRFPFPTGFEIFLSDSVVTKGESRRALLQFPVLHKLRSEKLWCRHSRTVLCGSELRATSCEL